ncbi:brachyurin [Drosophila tropicalis]|uniref:brachyurin n=1 Tax=Drosophila tropicalis TaxID=46794 RepID=UPI0035AB70C6
MLFAPLIIALTIGLTQSRPNDELVSQGRIAGGMVATESQFPHQVGLSIEEQNSLFSWCGGSLISEEYVLTAAHCVEEAIAIVYYLGGVQRLAPQQLMKSFDPSIQLHPDWNTKTLENDIALLKLPQPAILSGCIKPIKLPAIASSYASYDYKMATTSGWGRINDVSTAISNELRYVVRYVESNEDCIYTYANVKPTNICMDTTGGQSTCTGDSGGPLTYFDHTQNAEILIGVTSYGKKSGCTQGYPSVFTRVTAYLDWIAAVSGVGNSQS